MPCVDYGSRTRRHYYDRRTIALVNFLLIFLCDVESTHAQETILPPESINSAVKSPLDDANQIPPNIYQWIAENAHICTTVPLNGRSTVNFLSVDEGSRCSLCPEPQPGQLPKMACAVEIQPNSVDLDIGCHEIPELCVIELRERYAEFFAAGGKIPKAQASTVVGETTTVAAATVATTLVNEIFDATGDPFVEKNTVGEEFLLAESDATSTPTEEETTIMVRADQFTPEAGSAVPVDISANEISEAKSAAKKKNRNSSASGRRSAKKKNNSVDEELSRPIPPPSKRGRLSKSRNGRVDDDDDDDEKNEDDGEQKKVCRDAHELCCFWASAGECDENPFWMRVNCAKTCGTCNCKVRNANKCVSKGVECQTTTTSTTKKKTTPQKTTKTPTFSTSSTTLEAASSTKGRIRTLPPGFRTRPRGPRPRRPPGSASSSGGSQPPGHRPQRPPLNRPEHGSKTTVGKSSEDLDSLDYRNPDSIGDGDLNSDSIIVGDGDLDDNTIGVGGGVVTNRKDGKTARGGRLKPPSANDYGDGEPPIDDADGGEDDDSGDNLSNAIRGTSRGKMPKVSETSPTSSSTSGTSSSTRKEPSTPRETCFNFNRLCRFWAELGECERNPFWMRPHCQKACDSCGETVEDVLVPSQSPDCENQHTLCPFWAFIGECARNARWMTTHCRASCQLC